MSAKLIIFTLLILASVTAVQKLPEIFKSKLNLKQVGGNVNIPSTTCSQLNLTPLVSNNTLAWSGYLKAFSNSSNSAFAFTFYGSQQASTASQMANYPTILWLQGGPGASSQFGNFEEFGPYFPVNNSAGQISWNYNPYSWNIQYNLLFIDNPIGTGLSYAQSINEVPTHEGQVGTQLLYALQQLYFNNNGCFNQSSLSMGKSPLFIFGEGYGGKFATVLAEDIQKFNAKGGLQIPLKGLGLGDAFLYPGMVMNQMATFAYNLGLNDQQERQVTESLILDGLQAIQDNHWKLATDAYNQVLYSALMGASGLQNPFNFRQFQFVQQIDLDVLLNTPSIMYQFQLNPNITFQVVSQTIQQNFDHDFMQSDCFDRLGLVLQSNLEVLLFQGQDDLMICSPGSQSWIENLNYTSIKTYQKTQFTPWYVGGNQNNVGGYTKSAGNLQFWTVNRAGQMVPFDQPVSALQLVQTWIAGVTEKDQQVYE